MIRFPDSRLPTALAFAGTTLEDWLPAGHVHAALTLAAHAHAGRPALTLSVQPEMAGQPLGPAPHPAIRNLNTALRSPTGCPCRLRMSCARQGRSSSRWRSSSQPSWSSTSTVAA